MKEDRFGTISDQILKHTCAGLFSTSHVLFAKIVGRLRRARREKKGIADTDPGSHDLYSYVLSKCKEQDEIVQMRDTMIMAFGISLAPLINQLL